jgi:AcrR family transcriptional regulator
MAATSKRWERRSAVRPTELTRAALTLFAERGFAATRLEDVARAAGVSKATVYLYFENKERLFEAVVRETVAANLDHAIALVDAFAGTTEDLLRTLFGLFERVLDSNIPVVAKLVISESGNFPALAALWLEHGPGRVFGVLRRVLERGVARGELRELDLDATVPLLAAPIVMLAVWQQTFTMREAAIKLDPRAVLAAHLETFLSGVRRREDPEEAR